MFWNWKFLKLYKYNSNERMFNEHDIIYDVRLHIIIMLIDSFFEPAIKYACLYSVLYNSSFAFAFLYNYKKKLVETFL